MQNLRARVWGLLLASLVVSTAASAASPRRKVIIDQDAFGPGGPNLQPILMILQAADVEVLGITIESGDGWQAENTAHTLRMLELVGRPEIPVVTGATFPLVNSEEETMRWEAVHGKLPYKGAWMREWPDYNTVNRTHYHAAEVVPPLDEGAPSIKAVSEPAAVFIARKVREFPGEVTVVAMGPFTNLALASRLDEGFAAQAKEIIFMGGSFNPRPPEVDEFAMQFIHSPRVEFNSRWDPEAAKMMLHAGWKKVTAIPTDATTHTKLTAALLKKATESSTPLAKYVAKYGQAGFPMWDEVAAAVLLDPSVIKHSERLAMDIDIDHGADYGATLSWPAGKGPRLGEPDVTAVLEIDVPKLEALFVDLIGKRN